MTYTKQHVCKDAIKAFDKSKEIYDRNIVEKDGNIAMTFPDKIDDVKESVIVAKTKVESAKRMLDADSKKMTKYDDMHDNLESKYNKLKNI